MTPQQQHIAAHCLNGKWDTSKSFDENVNPFNLQCFVGMIETGEITWNDLRAVGGDILAATVAKRIVRRNEDE